MRRIAAMMVGLLLVCVLASCGTRRGYRDDDPYVYKRGNWNFSKGGLFDDIPQFTQQTLQSMFDYGPQPVDPPSEYETITAAGDSTSSGADTLAASDAAGAGASGAARAEIASDAAEAADAAVSAGSGAIEAGAPKSVGGRIAAEAAGEAANAAAKAAQPEMTWK
ncbi:MAG: hypothetical protein WCP22_01415 [Chlamydiota bacterium]